MNTIDFEILRSTLMDYKAKKVMLTFHSLGDTDSVSSAFALAEYFSDSIIATPDYITTNSKRILERLGFNEGRVTNKFDDSVDLVIMLDVNNFDDCGAFKDKLNARKKPILIIDHHVTQDMHNENVMVFNDEFYNSTASIIYEILKPAGIMISKSIAELLALGIISDSAEFRNASYKTFEQVGELLNIANIDYVSLLPVMQHTASIESRAQSMQDLFNSKTTVISGLLFTSGTVKGHANQSAEDAIKVGADLSLFSSVNKKEVSFSARLRPPLDKELGIHLGKVMRELGPTIGGHGGGHPCAAGAYGPSTQKAEEFYNKFVNGIIKAVDESRPHS
jgi:nanoRNase/pAp phosphatase (c-di-AMP/oligoRNAs hydrolase)